MDIYILRSFYLRWSVSARTLERNEIASQLRADRIALTSCVAALVVSGGHFRTEGVPNPRTHIRKSERIAHANDTSRAH